MRRPDLRSCALPLLIALSTALFACSSSSGSTGGGGGGQAPTCQGYAATTTEYTGPEAPIAHFPAHLQAKLDLTVDYTAYTLSLPDGADVSLQAKMPIDGGGLKLDTLESTLAWDAQENLDIYTIPQQVLAPGDHELRVFSGKTGTGPYEVTILAYDAEARRCDPTYSDPLADAADALATPECDALFVHLNDSNTCFGIIFEDTPENRQLYCGAVVAPCVRAAREMLACMAQKSVCTLHGTTPANASLTVDAPECAVRPAACP